MSEGCGRMIGPYPCCTITTGDASELASVIPDESIDLVITSPPYWNQKAYASWPTYGRYLADVTEWVEEVARLLKAGRHCFWVIPDKLPWPPRDNGSDERLYMPVYADTERVAIDCGLVPEFPIIWKKPHGTQKMFGSYPYPPTIIHTPMTERICVWRKLGKYPKPSAELKEASQFTKEQWVDYAQDLWEINPESQSWHPAPFPPELVRRILTLWSFIGDTVWDPFMGSGTVAIVASEMGRHWFGTEKNPDYAERARQRVRNTQLPLFVMELE